MKKKLAFLCSLALCFSALAACGGADKAATDEGGAEEVITVTVAATPAPHAEILEVAKEVMAAEGITLDIQEFNDYVQPNMATDSGDVMANYFQHIAYLESFNQENGTDLVSVASIHYEPYGLYAGKVASIEELTDGAQIAVPNDPSNEARALLLLEAQGLITLADGVGLNATKLDIVENELNLDIVEMEAAQLAGALSSLDMAVINGNYAIDAGLSVAKDAVAIEDAGSEAATLYANVLVVKAGMEEDPGILALKDALMSEEVRDFIEATYDGAVVPLF